MASDRGDVSRDSRQDGCGNSLRNEHELVLLRGSPLSTVRCPELPIHEIKRRSTQTESYSSSLPAEKTKLLLLMI